MIEAKQMSDADAKGFEENFEHLSLREKILMADRQHYKNLAEFRLKDTRRSFSREDQNFESRHRQIEEANKGYGR